VIIRILVAILAAISMVSCSGEHKSAASEPISDPQEYRFTLSPDEQRYVDEELGGSLLIYTRDRESVFEPDKYGPDEHGGLEFEMAKLLAGVLSLELEYRLVDDFPNILPGTVRYPMPPRWKLLAGAKCRHTPPIRFGKPGSWWMALAIVFGGRSSRPSSRPFPIGMW
jgi:hypothetical protein